MGKGGGSSDSGYGPSNYNPVTPDPSVHGPVSPYAGVNTGSQVLQPGAPQAQTPNVFSQSAQALTQGGNALTGAGGLFTSAAMSPISAGMSRYMNPYTNQVIGGVMSDIDRQRQMANVQGEGAAQAAGAFGGARHGLVEAQTNEAAMRQMGQFGSQLRQQGFNQAGQFAGQDIQNRLGAASGLASLAPQAANLAQTGFGMGRQIQGDQMAQGELVRGISEALLGQGAGMFDRYTGQPQDILKLRLGALGANPLNQAGTSTTNTQQPKNPMSAISGISSLFTKGAV